MAALYLEMCMDCIYGSSLSRDVYGLYIYDSSLSREVYGLYIWQLFI